MRTLNAISSPLLSKVHTTAAAAEAVASHIAEHCSQLPALNRRSSIQCQSGRTRSLPAFGCRGFVGGDQSLIMQGKSSITSVVGRAARGAAGEVASAAFTEISPGELEKTGDSYFLTDTRPVILFDGVCNMCNGTVNFLLDNDKEGKVRFAALQSEAGSALLVKSGLPPDYMSSVVLVGKDRSFINSEAILRIGQFLNFPFTPAASLGLSIPLFLRDALYRQVADNRYNVFGKSDACRLSDSRFTERFVE